MWGGVARQGRRTEGNNGKSDVVEAFQNGFPFEFIEVTPSNAKFRREKGKELMRILTAPKSRLARSSITYFGAGVLDG
jgi:hypothetical protein